MNDLCKMIRSNDRSEPRPAPRNVDEARAEEIRRRVIDEVEAVESEAAQ